MVELKNRLEPLIENFEAQSGDGLGPLTDSTYICVTNVTSLPEPQALPISSSQANVEAKTSLRHEAKLERKRAGTVTNVQLLNSINSMSSDLNAGLKEVVQAIQSSSTTQSTSIPLGVNWTPIIQGLVSGVATSLGATLSFPSSTAQAGTTTQAQTPSNSSPLGVNWTPILQGLVSAVATTLGSSVKFTPTGQSSDEVPLANSSTLGTPVSQENLTPIESRLNNLESTISSLNTKIHNFQTTQVNLNNTVNSLASTVDTLAQGQVSLTTSLNTLSQTLETFIKAQISNSGNSSGSNGNTGSNGSSLPPSGTSTTNGNSAPSGVPQSYLHAKAEKEGKIIIEYPSCTMIAVPHLNSDNDDVYFTADDFLSTCFSRRNYIV